MSASDSACGADEGVTKEAGLDAGGADNAAACKLALLLLTLRRGMIMCRR